MSFCLRPIVCKKCGKPLTLFEGRTCLECNKAEQEPVLNKIKIDDMAHEKIFGSRASKREVSYGIDKQ